MGLSRQKEETNIGLHYYCITQEKQDFLGFFTPLSDIKFSHPLQTPATIWKNLKSLFAGRIAVGSWRRLGMALQGSEASVVQHEFVGTYKQAAHFSLNGLLLLE